MKKKAVIILAALICLAGLASAAVTLKQRNFCEGALTAPLSYDATALSMAPATYANDFPKDGPFEIAIYTAGCSRPTACAHREIAVVQWSTGQTYAIISRGVDSTVIQTTWQSGSKVVQTITSEAMAEYGISTVYWSGILDPPDTFPTTTPQVAGLAESYLASFPAYTSCFPAYDADGNYLCAGSWSQASPVATVSSGQTFTAADFSGRNYVLDSAATDTLPVPEADLEADFTIVSGGSYTFNTADAATVLTIVSGQTVTTYAAGVGVAFTSPGDVAILSAGTPTYIIKTTAAFEPGQAYP